MTSIERVIIKLIIAAQMWSDAAKGISSTLEGSEYHSVNSDSRYCYYKKDKAIEQAVSLLNKVDRTMVGIRYYITKDSNVLGSTLIYFEIHTNGTKCQVSFHSFNPMLKKRIGSGMPMRWKGIEGSSRIAAEELQVILNK